MSHSHRSHNCWGISTPAAREQELIIPQQQGSALSWEQVAPAQLFALHSETWQEWRLLPALPPTIHLCLRLPAARSPRGPPRRPRTALLALLWEGSLSFLSYSCYFGAKTSAGKGNISTLIISASFPWFLGVQALPLMGWGVQASPAPLVPIPLFAVSS